jgi:predicted ester cyclase
MATPDLATAYCRFVEGVINHRCLDELDQFLAPDVVEHASATTVGLEPVRRRLAHWLEAVPDAHLVIEDLVVEGDHLMARLRATGTPRAAVRSESTGTRVSVSVFEAWPVRDGRCVERWLHIGRSPCEPPPPGSGRNGMGPGRGRDETARVD